MFQSTNRLRKSEDIDIVYNAKKILSNDFFRIHFDFEGGNGPKFAVVTGKKLGKATVRNKLRRQVREALKPLIEALPKNLRMVVIIKNQVNGLEFIFIERKLRELVEKIRF